MIKTKSLITFSLLAIFFLIIVLYFCYQNDSKIKFFATVTEVNGINVLIVPFSTEKIAESYHELSAYIENVKVGDILEITAKSEIKETYPAIIEIISYKIIISPTTTTTTTLPIINEEAIQ